MKWTDWFKLVFLAPPLLLVYFGLTGNGCDSRKQQVIEQHRQQGFRAYQVGVPAEANPQTHSDYREWWLEGWIEAAEAKKGAAK